MAGSILASAGTQVMEAVRRMRRYFWLGGPARRASLRMSKISARVNFFLPPLGEMKVNVPVGLWSLMNGKPVWSLSHSSTWLHGLSRISNSISFSGGLAAGGGVSVFG